MLGQITTLPQRKVGVDVDNSYVVAHNVDLLVKYQAHINVEIVNRDGMEKYLFKYSTKGPGYAKVGIGIRDGANEIQQYLKCRCVTPISHFHLWSNLLFSHTLSSLVHTREEFPGRSPIPKLLQAKHA